MIIKDSATVDRLITHQCRLADTDCPRIIDRASIEYRLITIDRGVGDCQSAIVEDRSTVNGRIIHECGTGDCQTAIVPDHAAVPAGVGVERVVFQSHVAEVQDWPVIVRIMEVGKCQARHRSRHILLDGERPETRSSLALKGQELRTRTLKNYDGRGIIEIRQLRVQYDRLGCAEECGIKCDDDWTDEGVCVSQGFAQRGCTCKVNVAHTCDYQAGVGMNLKCGRARRS